MLPLARRDVERFRQILGLQQRLMDMNLSPRAKRALMHRGPFREAMTWLEIHGQAPEVVEHWRGFIEAAGAFEGEAEGTDAEPRASPPPPSSIGRRFRSAPEHREPTMPLRLRAFELAHELHERLDALFGKRVVDRRAHAADRPMAFEAVEASGGGFLLECLFQLFARQPERDVHQRPAVLLRRAAIEAGAIDLARRASPPCAR